jgi:hypothetical protein
MFTTPRFTRSTALSLIAASALTGLVVTADAASAASTSTGSCDSIQDPPAQLPSGVQDGDRLFATTYRGYIVQITCGRLELVEPTGWASCYFLYGDEVLGYPC